MKAGKTKDKELVNVQDTVIAVLTALKIPYKNQAAILGLSPITPERRANKDNIKELIENITLELLDKGLEKAKNNYLDAIHRYQPTKYNSDGSIDWDNDMPISERKLALECGKELFGASGVFKDNSGTTVTNIVNRNVTIVSPVVAKMLETMKQRTLSIPDPE